MAISFHVIILVIRKYISESKHETDIWGIEARAHIKSQRMVVWVVILKSLNENVVKNYNSFSPLLDHVECFKWNNFGHKDHDCRRSTLRFINQRRVEAIMRNRNQRTKVQRRKQENKEECELPLYVQNHKILWYVDSVCSHHMTWDKSKFLSLKKVSGSDVTLGDNTSTKIIRKWIVSLDYEEDKAKDILFVEGLKHNTIIQMVDKWNEVKFHSKSCKIRKEGSKY